MVTIVEQLRGIQPKQPSPEEPQLTIKQIREQQITKGVSRIDIEIQGEKDRISTLTSELRKLEQSGTSTSAERGQARDLISDSRRVLKQLGKARVNIQSGFTFESSIARASQIALVESKRAEARQQARIELAKQEAGRITPAQARAVEEAGRRIVELESGERIQLPSQAQIRRSLEESGAIERLTIDPSAGLISPLEPPEKTFVQRGVAATTEFLFGEKGQQLVGVGLPGIQFGEPEFTFREIKEAGREFKIPKKAEIAEVTSFILTVPFLDIEREKREEVISLGLSALEFEERVVTELIPTTPGEIAITGGLVGAVIVAPPVIGTIISGGITGLGIKGVLDTELTLEQRTASGLIAVGGVVGVTAGVVPFIRGIGAKPVKIAPEGFPVIKGVGDIGDIGLIQPGRGAVTSIDLPPTSPLVKGGFGRIPGGEQRFIGTEQLLATSQRGFFKVGRDIPIEREFFVTPEEPFLGIAETRISRLGLVDLFKIPKDVEIGFGIPKPPQIGITRGAVGRREALGVFEIGRGTELEAIKTRGVITDIEKIGRARIRGEGVEIFQFEVGKAKGLDFQVGKGRGLDFRTTRQTGRVSGETLISTTLTRQTGRITGLTTPLVSLGISPFVSPPISPGISPPVSPPISPGISPPISPPLISPPISPPVSPPTISPPIFPPFFPPTEPPPRRRGKRTKPRKKPPTKKRTTPIRPSFTAIVAELTGGLPEIKTIGDIEIGILPTQIRRLPKKKTKKKKK